MGKKLSPYGRKEWHRKHSGNKTVHKSIDAVFRGAGAIWRSCVKDALRKDWPECSDKVCFYQSCGWSVVGFFIASASCGLGMSFVCGVVVFWVALSIFSMIHGTAKGIKDGYLQGDAEDSDDAKQIYTPNPEWMGEMDLVDSRKNAKILAPQFLKQARESARILETTTDPATFFMRYDFCVGRLLELEKCKRYGGTR